MNPSATSPDRSPAPALSNLIALIPPPAEPLPAGDLAHLETTLGHRLPDDYHDLLRVYGTGLFCNDFQVWGGGSIESGRNLTARQELPLRTLPNVIHTVGNPVAWTTNDGSPLPPEFADPHVVDSLTGWGSTSAGEYGFWHRTNSDPNHWPVVITDLTGSYDYHTGGLVAYLYGLYSDQFTNRQFMHADVLPTPPFFAPG